MGGKYKLRRSIGEIIADNISKVIGLSAPSITAKIEVHEYGNSVMLSPAMVNEWNGLQRNGEPFPNPTKAEIRRRRKETKQREKGERLYERAIRLGYFHDCECNQSCCS